MGFSLSKSNTKLHFQDGLYVLHYYYKGIFLAFTFRLFFLDYFAMVQSETGLSRVHFEASLELGTSTGAPEAISAEVKKIKEPKQLAPEILRCQNPGCSLQPLEEGQFNSSKV